MYKSRFFDTEITPLEFLRDEVSGSVISGWSGNAN